MSEPRVFVTMQGGVWTATAVGANGEVRALCERPALDQALVALSEILLLRTLRLEAQVKSSQHPTLMTRVPEHLVAQMRDGHQAPRDLSQLSSHFPSGEGDPPF